MILYHLIFCNSSGKSKFWEMNNIRRKKKKKNLRNLCKKTIKCVSFITNAERAALSPR